MLAEVYGLRKARRAIIAGFVLAGLASLTFWLVSVTPPAPDWANQEAWQAVLGFVPRIVLASLLGFLAGQFLNAYVLVKIKQLDPREVLVGQADRLDGGRRAGRHRGLLRGRLRRPGVRAGR